MNCESRKKMMFQFIYLINKRALQTIQLFNHKQKR